MLILTSPTSSMHRTSRERWKIAIAHVIQGRTQRSRWSSVLLKAKQHRVELVFDLLRDLPVLEDVPKAQALQLCASSMLQTYAHDSIVFAKGESSGDRCFLVLAGSVALQQVCAGTNSSSAPLVAGAPSPENMSLKITVQTMEVGDVFGDFELLSGKSERQINAITSDAATKLLTFPREEFLLFWPRHARLEAKLHTIKHAFYGVHNLDSDHLCSLYYAMQEKSFKRNEGEMRQKRTRSSMLFVPSDLRSLMKCTLSSGRRLQPRRFLTHYRERLFYRSRSRDITAAIRKASRHGRKAVSTSCRYPSRFTWCRIHCLHGEKRGECR